MRFLTLSFLALVMTACSATKPDSYYSVNLTNNILYFGKISKITPDVLELKDVYYLQRVPVSADKPQETKLNLVKQVKDLTGPSDTLTLNRQHVLSYQELRADSSIVSGISKQKEEEKKALEAKAAPAEAPSTEGATQGLVYRPQPQFFFDHRGVMQDKTDPENKTE